MTKLTPEQQAELNAIWDEAAAQPIPSYTPATLDGLRPETRASIIAALDGILDAPAAPIVQPDYVDKFPADRVRDASALHYAKEIIENLQEGGHGDYSKYLNEIADLWDGEYGLWYGNNECTTELEDPNLQDLRLIQEDHYDQHMDEDEDKPDWDDMICSVGDYVFFA